MGKIKHTNKFFYHFGGCFFLIECSLGFYKPLTVLQKSDKDGSESPACFVFFLRENKALEICSTPFLWLPVLLIYPRSVVKIHIHSSVGLSFKDLWGESESHSGMSDSLRSNGLYSPWNSPVRYTGVGRLSLLQGISPTQGSNRSSALHVDSLQLIKRFKNIFFNLKLFYIVSYFFFWLCSTHST